MSSTSRGKTRSIHDFYVTPEQPIKDFLNKFLSIEKGFNNMTAILDPSAGGNEKYDMPYPKVLKEIGFDLIFTMDIREDSKAGYKGDYLISNQNFTPEIVITNPPFNLAVDFVKKALQDVSDGGFVIMFLRLNFLGTQGRYDFWQENLPKYCFVHSERPSFFPEDITLPVFNKKKNEWEDKTYKKGSTDSCEYAHFVWQKGYEGKFINTLLVKG